MLRCSIRRASTARSAPLSSAPTPASSSHIRHQQTWSPRRSIVPDAATAIPSVSANGLTYAFHIKSRVMWNTTPSREVTSQDFKRGIERNCDPTLARDGNPTYYTATITGFTNFCTPFEAMSTSEQRSGTGRPTSMATTRPASRPRTARPSCSLSPSRRATSSTSSHPVRLGRSGRGPQLRAGDGRQSRSTRTGRTRSRSISSVARSTSIATPSGARARTPSATTTSAPSTSSSTFPDLVQMRVQDDIATGAADLGVEYQVPAEDVAGMSSPAWNPEYRVYPQAGTTAHLCRFNVLSPNNNGALGKLQGPTGSRVRDQQGRDRQHLAGWSVSSTSPSTR